MSDSFSNPYAAPESEIIAANSDAGKLASPWIRLGAVLIDGIILFPLHYLMGKVLYPVDQDAVNAAIARGEVAEALSLSTPSVPMIFLGNVISVAVLVAINWKFLPQGQTIGKKVTKIQIQSRSGGLLPVKDIIAKRMAPLYLAGCVPFIGPVLVLIDALCIFRSGHNTLHDDIAGSKVVKV